MYDNTVVEKLSPEDAVKFMINCNMTVNAVKGNIIFGNGTFTGEQNGLGPSSSYKQVCLSIIPDTPTSADDVLLAYFKTSPNVEMFTEVADAQRKYLHVATEVNNAYNASNCENVINNYTPLLADRYIQVISFNYGMGNNNKNKYLIIELNGRTREAIVEEWRNASKTITLNVVAEARMALIRMFKKAVFISGGNDQLIIFNDNASIQYNVITAQEDDCGDYYDTTYYAVLSVKGEKYYCHSENDLLSHFHRELHLIDV